MRLVHTCQNENDDCACCLLIDQSITLLAWFNKRPDEFHSTHAHKLISTALSIKMAIEESRGVIKTGFESYL
jgi:hypothetical protein